VSSGGLGRLFVFYTSGLTGYFGGSLAKGQKNWPKKYLLEQKKREKLNEKDIFCLAKKNKNI
jgi:hypothetical protein